MILICPECAARYVLPAQSLGGEGRNVRCASCAHTWFQQPDEEEVDQAEAQEFEPIPESVQPQHDDEAETDAPDMSVPVLKDDLERAEADDDYDDEEGEASNKEALVSYALVAVIALVMLTVLVNSRDQIVQAWPPSALLFSTIGYDVPLPGAGLVFDRLEASIEEKPGRGDVMTVKGHIINLSPEERAVPPIEASLVYDDVVETPMRWMIDPVRDSLNGEESLEFVAEYADIPENATSVNLTFKPY